MASAVLLPAEAICRDAGLRHAMTPDDRALSLLLIAAWAARTRRVLRSVPVSELSSAELVNFWADDQLEYPLDVPVKEWGPR